ncbi:GNAT family N-acetyltransferase [Streptomyces sp. NPDC048002]|uniref:GNAT family N-acetyltransferase n=1 Tax=Streptomyces sp. NPDC048002 TaxID=3154344 RepID=UPI0033E675BC
MDDLRVVVVDGERLREQWRYVHNVVVPPDELSADEVRERVGRHRLENAYLGDVLVGCSTVRPPDGERGVATVIARVLPEYRGRGIGAALYEHCLARAFALGAREVRTVVLAANADGVRFARKRGFVEVERYVAPEDETEVWLTLRLES